MKLALVGIVGLVAACHEEAPPAPAPAPAVVPAAPIDASLVRRAATCDQAIAHLAHLALGGDPDAMLEECNQQEWSDAYRACIAVVPDRIAISACDRESRLARGMDLGGPACELVVAHLAEVEHLDAQKVAAGRAGMRATCEALPRAMKECVLAATDHAGLTGCAARHTDPTR